MWSWRTRLWGRKWRLKSDKCYRCHLEMQVKCFSGWVTAYSRPPRPLKTNQPTTPPALKTNKSVLLFVVHTFFCCWLFAFHFHCFHFFFFLLCPCRSDHVVDKSGCSFHHTGSLIPFKPSSCLMHSPPCIHHICEKFYKFISMNE